MLSSKFGSVGFISFLKADFQHVKLQGCSWSYLDLISDADDDYIT